MLGEQVINLCNMLNYNSKNRIDYETIMENNWLQSLINTDIYDDNCVGFTLV